jgi:hypothetical protein
MGTLRQSCLLAVGMCIIAVGCEHDKAVDVQRSSESNVQIDLRALYRSSSPTQPGSCSSTIDSVSLLVDPEDGSQQQYGKKLAEGDSIITFGVTVEQGSVQFTANVLSNNQTLLYSKTQRTEVKAEGFEVGLQLDKKAPVMVVCPDLLVVAWQSRGTFLMENVGIGTLNWRVVNVPPSLSINPATGSLPAQSKDTIVVQSNDTTRETFPIRFDSQAGYLDLAIQNAVFPPATPALLSPQDRATNVPINPTTFTWNAPSGAATYQLQVSTDSTFSRLGFDQTGISTNSFSTNRLVNSTTYFWRVNASNAAGVSPFSAAWHFATIPLPPATPNLVSPQDGATSLPTDTVRFKWNASNGATAYQLQYSTDSTFLTMVVKLDNIDTTLTVSGLSNNTTYFWRVNASNAGGTSSFSPYRRFTTIVAPPAAPTLLAPQDGATDVPINPSRFTWNASNGATAYQLQYSTDSTFSTAVVTYSDIMTTLFAVSGPSGNTTYYWHVRASNAGGTSPFSSTWHFTTMPLPPLAPALVSPQDGATDIPINPLTFTWNASAGAAFYQLHVSTDSIFSTTVLNQSGIATTSFAVSGLSNNATYFWHVKAWNAGGSSPFSSAWRFTTIVAPPLPPTLVSPQNGATNVPTDTTRFTWNASIGATAYQLQYSKDSTFSATVVTHSFMPSTSFVETQLSSNTTYFWHVRASNAGGSSAFSEIWRFTTTSVGVILSPHNKR